jgi:RNA polymerase II subunit A C-terminal domain phosphatase
VGQDDFFVGIGDINSAFLPKQEPLVPVSATSNGAVAVVPSQTPPKEGTAEDDVVDPTLMQIKEQGRMLEAQMEDRPLAKEQEKLNDGSASNASVSGREDRERSKGGSPSESEVEDEDEIEQRALLTNDDDELVRVEGVLMEIHKRFYGAYEDSKNSLRSPPAQNGHKPSLNYDVTVRF